MSKINYLRVTVKPIEPNLNELICLEWEVAIGSQVIDYSRVFEGKEINAKNDFKSHFDWMWNKAKQEIETRAFEMEGEQEKA